LYNRAGYNYVEERAPFTAMWRIRETSNTEKTGEALSVRDNIFPVY